MEATSEVERGDPSGISVSTGQVRVRLEGPVRHCPLRQRPGVPVAVPPTPLEEEAVPLVVREEGPPHVDGEEIPTDSEVSRPG